MSLSVSILGTLEVRAGDGLIGIGAPRHRTLLAMLVRSADRAVSVDAIADAVWNGRPPATARTQVAICVASLRKTFGKVGHPDVIETVHPGYVLRSAGVTIDSVEFVKGIAAAQSAKEAGRTAEAAELLEQALAGWRGAALTGLSGHALDLEAQHLEEQRLTALEQLAELRLVMGQHNHLVGELTELVRLHPLREHLRVYLMLAQYRSGRRAEALAMFRDSRRRLIEDLGIGPGPVLQKMHESILRDDPGLMLEATAAPGLPTLTVTPVPAQLPSNVHGFTGRELELSMLDGLLTDPDPGNPVRVGFVSGLAGSGRTALAVHWAHRASENFPDGQLVADLRLPEGRGPARPEVVLAGFLTGLRVPAEDMPFDLEGRASLYRTLLSTRRMLVLLDNVDAFEQVEPLLPGSGACCVVMTGYEQPYALLSRHSVLSVRTAPLTAREATEVLRRVVGDVRCAASPTSVRRLADLCDRLPLALRIAGARLAARPQLAVERLVERLEEPSTRLDELTQTGYGMRQSLAQEHGSLSRGSAAVLRAVASLIPSRFTAPEAAAVARISVPEADRFLESLVETGFLDAAGADSRQEVVYRCLDLVRLFVLELAHSDGWTAVLDSLHV